MSDVFFQARELCWSNAPRHERCQTWARLRTPAFPSAGVAQNLMGNAELINTPPPAGCWGNLGEDILQPPTKYRKSFCSQQNWYHEYMVNYSNFWFFFGWGVPSLSKNEFFFNKNQHSITWTIDFPIVTIKCVSSIFVTCSSTPKGSA